MSTIPESITAVHCGIPVLAVSLISNLCTNANGSAEVRLFDVVVVYHVAIVVIGHGVLKKLDSCLEHD